MHPELVGNAEAIAGLSFPSLARILIAFNPEPPNIFLPRSYDQRADEERL